MSIVMWVLAVLSALLPSLGAFYWTWYRGSLDDEGRLEKPSGAAVFLTTLAAGGITLFALIVLVFLRSILGFWGY